jgi:hypothetical protein
MVPERRERDETVQHQIHVRKQRQRGTEGHPWSSATQAPSSGRKGAPGGEADRQMA